MTRINLGQIARWAHNNNEYFIFEKGGIPVIDIMAMDELEDYLEMRDPKVKNAIASSRKDYAAGKSWSAGERYRLRSGRFRYDIFGNEAVLHDCGLRREGSY